MTNDNQQTQKPGRLAVYASVGSRMGHYEVDVGALTLTRRASVMLPAKIQYAWPHVSKPFLYVASTNGGPNLVGDKHYANALRIDPGSGALEPHGAPAMLRSRPVHITTDIPSEHVVTAYTDANGVTVHRVNTDGTLGAEVRPPAALDVGIFAHQTRVMPSNRGAILVTRGYDAKDGKPEDPGALKVFSYKAGVLTNQASIAPGNGYGFGPRHLDFHPTGPWVYVSLERQNKLNVFKLEGDTLRAEPLFRKETMVDPDHPGPRQLVGTIHVHPNGRFVYVINRAYGTKDAGGRQVFSGGENNIAVFAVDPVSGEPTLIQNIDTHGYYARTFSIDPSGRMLVAAHVMPMVVQEGAGYTNVPANLSVFRIADDGKLDFARKYDVDVGSNLMFWMGMLSLK